MARISKVLWSCRSRFCKLLAEVAAIRKRTFSRNQHDVGEEGHRPDDDDGDFGYRETRCLSSYYSVFVARLAIMVMLAILIGLLTFLTWHFTMVYTKKSIQSLAYNLRYELLQRPISRMSSILNTTVEITNAQVWLAEYVVKRYPVPQSPNEDNAIYEVMREITWAIFVSRKALNAITVSYNNGRVQAFHRDRMSTGTYYMFSQPMSSTSTNNSVVLDSNDVISNASLYDWISTSTVQNNSFIWYREPVDPATGKAIGPSITVPSDDLMNITGISTIEDEDASWQVTVSKFTDSPLLASKSPVRHPANSNIVAVVGVRTALSSVGRLMKELVEMHGGYMFLVSHEGYLLATSTDTPLMMNTSSGLKLITATESTNAIISAGARWLQEYADGSYLYNDVHVENVMLGNHRYYIDTFTLNLTQPAVVGVIIIPRSFVMGKVDRQSHAALIILVSASVCILVIGCFCILILTSGVSKEMKLRAELISHLDARRRAEASSNYKSQFLANMSHELRTPMAAVIGLLDILLCDNYLSTEQIDMLSQIRRCSTALLRLLNNILDLSKVESGKLVLEEAEFDIEHELEALIDMFSVQCVDHNIDIILDLDDNIPKLVCGDSARVVQIFANLINNSIKFTSSGCIILRGWRGNSPINKPTDEGFRNSHQLKMFKVMSSSHPEQQSKMQEKLVVCFEVEDTGCGIDQSKWESVFESFVQADLSTTRTHGGTGLGLCIVRSLVEQMKGHISIKPKSGPGTLIQLSLEFGIPPQSLQQLSQHTWSRFMKENPLVLLALTDSISGITISRWLQQNGIQSIQACDWEEIMDNLSRNLDNCLDSCSRKIVSECQTNHKLDSGGLPFPGDKASVKHSRCSPDLENLNYFVIIDAKFVESHTDIWKSRLSYLNKYKGRAKFAWLLNHDTSTTLKLELRRMGHNIMVNKPLYKSKLIQILENMVEDVAAQEGPVTVHSKVPTLLSEEEEKQGRISTEIPSRGVSLLSSKSDMEVTMGSVDFDLTYQNPNQLCADNLRKEMHYDSHHTLEGDKALQLSQSTRMSAYLDCNDGTEQNYRSSGTRNEYGRKNHLNDTVNSGLSSACHGCRNDFAGNTKQSSHSTTKFTGTHCNNNNVELQLALEHRSKFSETQPISAGPLTTPFSNISITFNSDDNLSSREQISPCQSIKIDKNIRHAEDPYIVAKHELRSSAVQHTPSNAIFKDKSLQGIHILLAEDTPVLQKVAMTVLQKMGASVVAVGDGLQAVNALKSSLNFQAMNKSTPEGSTEKDGDDVMTSNTVPFDLILMDCQMPKMDGYEATKAIRRAEEGTDQHIPIIALTAHAMSSDEAKCLEVGMDAYLTKPIDYALMTSTMLSLLRKTK